METFFSLVHQKTLGLTPSKKKKKKVLFVSFARALKHFNRMLSVPQIDQ